MAELWTSLADVNTMKREKGSLGLRLLEWVRRDQRWTEPQGDNYTT